MGAEGKDISGNNPATEVAGISNSVAGAIAICVIIGIVVAYRSKRDINGSIVLGAVWTYRCLVSLLFLNVIFLLCMSVAQNIFLTEEAAKSAKQLAFTKIEKMDMILVFPLFEYIARNIHLLHNYLKFGRREAPNKTKNNQTPKPTD